MGRVHLLICCVLLPCATAWPDACDELGELDCYGCHDGALCEWTGAGASTCQRISDCTSSTSSAMQIDKIPPSTLEALGLGFAQGFISDGPDVMMCGQLALSEVASLREALTDLRVGITHFNLTEIQKAITEFKDVVTGLPTAKKECKTVVDDLGSILGSLKHIHGPKDLLFHIIDHLFDDSEKIFAEMAAAEHAYKSGWDYMTAGQQLGMSVRRLLIGEGGDKPKPPPAPPAAKKEMLEGIAIGFVSDNLEFANCTFDLRHESSDFKAAFNDFEQGFTHLNVTKVEAAVKEFEEFVKGAAPTKATCAAAVTAVESDVKTILKALKSVHGIKGLVDKVIDNFFGDGEVIFGDLSAASKAYRLAEYVGSGRELGMAFRRMLVGNTTARLASTSSTNMELLV